MHSALKIASVLLNLAEAAGKKLTPMQMLKLVFLCHGWMLGLYGKPLIRDEVQAWRYGPVIPNLYHAVKHYRSNSVTHINGVENGDLDYLEDDLVRQVYTTYGDLDGIMLSEITHKRNSPWDQTYRNARRNIVISNDLIQAYYAGLSAASERAGHGA